MQLNFKDILQKSSSRPGSPRSKTKFGNPWINLKCTFRFRKDGAYTGNGV